MALEALLSGEKKRIFEIGRVFLPVLIKLFLFKGGLKIVVKSLEILE